MCQETISQRIPMEPIWRSLSVFLRKGTSRPNKPSKLGSTACPLWLRLEKSQCTLHSSDKLCRKTIAFKNKNLGLRTKAQWQKIYSFRMQWSPGIIKTKIWLMPVQHLESSSRKIRNISKVILSYTENSRPAWTWDSLPTTLPAATHPHKDSY